MEHTYVPNRNTYYATDELAAIEAAAEAEDESFSGIVRRAVREHLEVGQ